MVGDWLAQGEKKGEFQLWPHLALCVNVVLGKETDAHVPIHMNHLWLDVWCGAVVCIPRFVAFASGIDHEI